MNEANPFQIPAWSQINREQRRRERFKKMVIVTVAAGVLLLVTMLTVGIKTELAARELEPAAGSQTRPVVARPTAIPIPRQTFAAVSSPSLTVYVVKTGDTLTGIARANGTTIKAIAMANGLTDDRILVGEKLKIPKGGGSALAP